MFTTYADYAIDLGVDLSAIFLLAYALYFRRHRRADLLLAYVALNIGIFVAMSLLSTVRVDIALGFGLFAILSIIRLRSSTVTQQEVAYYFVALVMGLVNGLDLDDRRLVIADQRPADRDHADRRQPTAAGPRAAPGRHPGHGPRRRRRAGGRPGAPAGRAGDAPRGQRHRLRAQHHGRRRALPGRDGRRRARRRAAPGGHPRRGPRRGRRAGRRPGAPAGRAGAAPPVKDIDYVRDIMVVDVRYRARVAPRSDRSLGEQIMAVRP